MNRRLFALAWLAWSILFVLLEGYALLRSGDGDTLSEQIWPLLEHPWILVPAVLAWLWLGDHFFLHPLRRKRDDTTEGPDLL